MHRGAECDDGINPATAKNLLQESITKCPTEKTRFWFSKRFCVIVLLSFGYLNTVLLKMNLNIAIVEMTSNKTIIAGNLTTNNKPEYEWDSKTIGVVQSAFAYGYLFGGIGVPMIDKFGGSVMVGTSLMTMAVINVLTPACLRKNFLLFYGTRILIGCLDGIFYMSALETVSRWGPVPERSAMISFCMAGIYIGIAVSYPVCGFLADRWGWQTVFYAMGVTGIIWSAIFLLVVKNQPSEDKLISKKELSYMLENTETSSRKQVVHPYKEIFTSSAVWAMSLCKFTYSWGSTLLMICFPLYIKDMTGRTTDEVGVISSIPNYMCILTIPLTGFVIDYWLNNSKFTVTQIHKIMLSTGFITGSILFVIASFSTSFTLSMACFTIINFMLSFIFLILQLVCLYMSPAHSSILGGLSSFWFAVTVFGVPLSVGFIVQNRLLEEWSKCFLLSGAILFAGAIIFIIYGSSELQPWAVKTITNTRVNRNYKIGNKIALKP